MEGGGLAVRALLLIQPGPLDVQTMDVLHHHGGRRSGDRLDLLEGRQLSGFDSIITDPDLPPSFNDMSLGLG